MMPDSDFWRDLAGKFRTIDPHRILRADWYCTVKIGEEPPPVAEWRLVGADRQTRSVQYEFETLARRGGPKVHALMESLIGWLEALREAGLNAEIEGTAIESAPDGTTAAHIYSGTIVHVCGASADFCKLQESHALEIERQVHVCEQKEKDPGSWSLLRQRWEARKMMHALTTLPPEEIPEGFVREVLAEQYGVKPEEVNRQQIQYEISWLLPAYPNIRIIPSATLPQLEDSQSKPLSPRDTQVERVALRNAYFESFRDEKIKVLDVCWAAGQHYSEFKRWLRGPAVLKDGSAPDLAFRALFTSGKSPREYRKQPRPKGWK